MGAAGPARSGSYREQEGPAGVLRASSGGTSHFFDTESLSGCRTQSPVFVGAKYVQGNMPRAREPANWCERQGVVGF
jgi:hypothetical protein